MTVSEFIYMDHAATTPVRPEVCEAMLPYLQEEYGNPSSHHRAGRRARDAIERSRERVAAALGAHPQEIIFTSGGTEADNLAVIGAVRGLARQGRSHLVTSSIEHHAVVAAAERVREEGGAVTVVPVDAKGRFDPAAVVGAVTPETGLVSLMLANNETGTLQPVRETVRALEGEPPLFHTDAVQAIGKVPVLLSELAVDLLSVSSHKIQGPKGAGALYVRKGTPLSPLLVGGPHEFGHRAGTENVPGIVGFSVALELAVREVGQVSRRLASLRDRLEVGLFGRIPDVTLTGHPQERLPNILNLRIHRVPAEALVVRLDEEGVAISAGSACTEETLEASHVLLALGLTAAEAGSAVRFSLGAGTSEGDVDRVIDLVVGIVGAIRAG